LALFHYPKAIHKRTQKPIQYKRYQTYKKWLQVEFQRVCVYCRQPDSVSPSMYFSVDHYRPYVRFPKLKCDYENLYYCCITCNSHKNKYWPREKSKDPLVIAPCSHEMSAHLRFSEESGIVEAKSVEGDFTINLLQLNDDEVVRYRQRLLRMVKLCVDEIATCRSQLRGLEKRYKKGKIDRAAYDQAKAMLSQNINDITADMHSFTGELPLPLLPTRRLGVSLMA
jgi:hypothetical protein